MLVPENVYLENNPKNSVDKVRKVVEHCDVRHAVVVDDFNFVPPKSKLGLLDPID